uniref:Coenzyme Q-binding protein COQ10 START domain-containing protein n=2 Tax=Aegilops tauschii subsp. strangulata TaxID=200361 RepID=A0A453GVX0_AEGTS
LCLPAMAMPSTASCCFVSSSPHGRRRLTHTTTAWSPARIRLVSRSAPSRNPLRRSSSSSEPAPGVAGDEGEYVDREVEEDRDERYGFEMEVRKLPGKKNRRLVRARVRVGAPLRAVWATLTDYEGLAGFIPGLSECRLLHQDKAFARLYQVSPLLSPNQFVEQAVCDGLTHDMLCCLQVGEQDLALGFKFNAKGTIDCYEGEMELLPESGARRREIDFNMVDGDFKVFQGKWSVQEVDGAGISAGQEFQTTLSYVVELEPKLWVPVRLLEGRICKEIKTNLICIREEAERIQRLLDE